MDELENEGVTNGSDDCIEGSKSGSPPASSSNNDPRDKSGSPPASPSNNDPRDKSDSDLKNVNNNEEKYVNNSSLIEHAESLADTGETNNDSVSAPDENMCSHGDSGDVVIDNVSCTVFIIESDNDGNPGLHNGGTNNVLGTADGTGLSTAGDAVSGTESDIVPGTVSDMVSGTGSDIVSGTESDVPGTVSDIVSGTQDIEHEHNCKDSLKIGNVHMNVGNNKCDGDSDQAKDMNGEQSMDSVIQPTAVHVNTKCENTRHSKVEMRNKQKSGSKDQEFSPVDVEFGIEDFGKMQKQAEQRLAARRAAREEARLIRMKELEKQQREMEEKQDRIFELTKDSAVENVVIPKIVARSYQGSRRGSDDSTSSEDTRELRKVIAELEDKYKKAMMNNASLDNEKQTYRYQVDLIKDQLEESEENYTETQRLLKERCRELDQKRRDFDDLGLECEYYKQQVQQRDKLIQEYGLIFINNDVAEEKDDKKGSKRRRKKKEEESLEEKAALVTPDAMSVLARVGGNLDEKLKSLDVERERLEGEVRSLRLQLEEEKEKSAMAEKYASPKRDPTGKEVISNGPLEPNILDANMEAQKQLTEYRYKLKKAEQDITVLEGNVIRLESQVKRWKASSDESEKDKEEMKAEKRKLQRELREKENQIAEYESQNENLQKRLEKFRKERMDAIISGKS